MVYKYALVFRKRNSGNGLTDLHTGRDSSSLAARGGLDKGTGRLAG